ncbi:MAG: hypothetical protein KBF22_07670, partial [Ottowia sp.]|nr:hypothetical protein [Ottowia sp.]
MTTPLQRHRTGTAPCGDGARRRHSNNHSCLRFPHKVFRRFSFENKAGLAQATIKTISMPTAGVASTTFFPLAR